MAASEIRIRVPHPSSALLNNMLGALGLVAMVIAVGGLAGWLWGLLASGIVAVTISLVGSTYAAPELAAAEESDAVEPASPVAAVPRSA
ncbi:hypothetical protein [Actinophytocola sediminis]